ncbi:hypothetical protein [Microcoleus sp. CAWBG58]|uniref:hypothetical protein n=1 Tax=Microcoleus sp. CAWBG58 TaxID=2841651 RepID=UPI0025CED4EB|nr:hypothetical protein [Microcoleus sp. CAWBG58]
MYPSSNKSHIARLQNLFIGREVDAGDRLSGLDRPPCAFDKPPPEAKLDTSTTAEDCGGTPRNGNLKSDRKCAFFVFKDSSNLLQSSRTRNSQIL